MSRPARPRYRSNPFRLSIVREVGILAIIAAGAFAVNRLGLAVDVVIWMSFGGIVLLAILANTRFRRRPAKPRLAVPAAGHKRRNWTFPALVGAVMLFCFAGVLFWPQIQSAIPRPMTAPATETGQIARAALPSFRCQVASVHDGDTLRCADGTRVRLHAVAAREIDETCSPGHPCPAASALAARETLLRLAAGQTLDCVQTGTSYNRIAAICRTPSGTEINCAMVKSGTTLLWERFDREEPICRSLEKAGNLESSGEAGASIT